MNEASPLNWIWRKRASNKCVEASSVPDSTYTLADKPDAVSETAMLWTFMVTMVAHLSLFIVPLFILSLSWVMV